MKRRHFILLLGGASSGALGIGTGAFSSVDAERGVEVDVVDDPSAYLGLKRLAAADSVPIDEETDVVRIQNQFATPLDLSVSLDESGPGIDEINVDGEALDPGDRTTVTLESPGDSTNVSVKCDETGKTSFTLSFNGDAGGASVDKTRTFEITCENQIDDVVFSGNSGAVHVKGAFEDLGVTVGFENGDEENRTISSGSSGKATLNGSGTIEYVTISDETYERPQHPSKGAGSSNNSKSTGPPE